MSIERVRAYFKDQNIEDRIQEFEVSSATVELAAQAIGCQEKQIAKTLSFLVDEAPILIVAAGHVKVDNKKYKAVFHQRPKMIPRDLVEDRIGHGVGGVCPFAVKPEVTIYLDASLKGSEVVYPAAGSECSVVQLSLEELERCTGNPTWVDVCKE